MAPAMMLTISLFPFSTHSKMSPKNSRIGSALVNAILASLFLILLSKNACAYDPDDAPELCVVRALDNRHVSPWLSQPRRTPGCSSHGQLSTEGAEVHVLRLLLDKGPQQLRPPPQTTHGLIPIDLLLDSTVNSSTTTLVLLLSSDRPVLWRIRGNGLSAGSSHKVLVCNECRVESGLALKLEGKDWPNKKALVRYAKKSLGAITSFTEVRGANRIEMFVGYGVAGELSADCDTSSNQMSSVASAMAVVPQQALGCYNGDLIGTSSGDVYVVEIAHQDLIRHAESSPPVQVFLQGEKTRSVPRNITLFLKAHRPTRWQLISHGIDGKIVVISDQQVENSEIGEKHSIEVRNTDLPDRLDALLLSAMNYGPLVLYARTERASGLDVMVSESKENDEEQLSGDMAGEDKITDSSSLIHPQQVAVHQHSVLRSTAISSLKSEEPRHPPMDDLRREMVVSCELKRMNISFPKSLAEKLNVEVISLDDPSCKSESNSTHVWLTTHITSCNTLSSSENEKTVYTNAVLVKFASVSGETGNDYDDDDNKLPVVCKYYSKFPGQFSVAYGGVDSESGPRSSKGNTLYMMELYRDSDHTDLLSFDSGPAQLVYDEKVYVRTWIESALAIQVVPEMCWISNTSDFKTTKTRKIYLVKKACATDLSVDVVDNFSIRAKNQHGGFNFQVNKAYSDMSLLYLHCQLGLCTHNPDHARGNLLMCASQAQNCFKSGLNYNSSTAQQVITRGPIILVPRKPKTLPSPSRIPTDSAASPMDPVDVLASLNNGLATKSPSLHHTPVPETRSTSVTHGNVSTEMAAVIALIAFMVGVIVTGSMWFIHVKTDPYRNGRKGQLQPALSSTTQHQQRSSPALGLNGQQAAI